MNDLIKKMISRESLKMMTVISLLFWLVIYLLMSFLNWNWAWFEQIPEWSTGDRMLLLVPVGWWITLLMAFTPKFMRDAKD